MATTIIRPNKDNFENDTKPPLPSSINTLTILTFIGSGIAFLYIVFMPALNKLMMGFMEKATESGDDLSASKLAEIERGKTVIELAQANIVPIMVIGLISVILCVVGAIWMRKLKKDGYWLYIAGELLPVIGNFIFLGTEQFTGVASIVFGLGLPLLFIGLYSMQLKFLSR
ncbi:hypothetical protein BH11BAC3_BH11BAC3_36550 [soil metagenome]